jgi:uncharacterized RDD family membrane protein YckC
MRTIDITTTQNVTIQYEVAELRDRALAFLFDLMLLFFGFIFLALLISAMSISGNQFAIVLWCFVLAPLFVFYSFWTELLFNGQTIGKKVLQIKVVKLNGKEPTAADHFLRWTFRLLDIWLSCGSLAATLVSSSTYAQRMGDLATNTAVIKMRSTLQFSLREILEISSLYDYSPRFPEVRQLGEPDMILIKNTLVRADKYRNTAHESAVIDLVHRICTLLHIAPPPASKHRDFLRTLLKDYIVLTR